MNRFVALAFAIAVSSGASAVAGPQGARTSTTCAIIASDLKAERAAMAVEKASLEESRKNLLEFERRIEARIAQLDELKARLEALRAKPKEEEKKEEVVEDPKAERIGYLAKLSERMPPENAAKLLTGLEVDTAASILEAMSVRRAAAVIAAMDVGHAAAVSKRYLRRDPSRPSPAPDSRPPESP